MARDYRKIKAWQLADELSGQVYEVTKDFPADERYEMTKQLRRAALSVPSNIAEGAGRATKRDYLSFCAISRGSLMELRSQLSLACRMGYMGEDVYTRVEELADRTAAVLHRLMEAIEREVEG